MPRTQDPTNVQTWKQLHSNTMCNSLTTECTPVELEKSIVYVPADMLVDVIDATSEAADVSMCYSTWGSLAIAVQGV